MKGTKRIAALAGLLCGCSSAPSFELKEWTLITPDGAERPITLPAHVDALLSKAPSRYRLRGRVEVPEAWRGGPAVLTISMLEAPVSLDVGGRPSPPLEHGLTPATPSMAAHRFHITAEQTAAGALDLELSAAVLLRRGAWIDNPPRLAQGTAGDRMFVLVRTLNQPAAIATFAILSMVGFTYVVLFALDRRRTVNAWFGVQSICFSYLLLEQLHLPQELLGQRYFGLFFAAAGPVAGLYFLHAYFGLERPHRAFEAALAVMLALAFLDHGPFGLGGPLYKVVVAVIAVVVTYQALLLQRRVVQGPDRGTAAVLLVGWVVPTTASGLDAIRYGGFGEIAFGGHTLVIGAAVNAVLQAVVLGRDHIRSLRAADALNLQLKAKVAALEEGARENALLSDELRRQIADRSQRLAEALARIGVVPARSGILEVGDEIHGRYRVTRPLGAGGMGAVYEVERLTDRRRLALKVLRSATSGEALARLAREAQVAAQVSHPNLVAIADVDVSDSGALYLVMELVDGASLSELRARFGEAGWAIPLLAQIARGLAALHERGVVHRDLKPANVLVTREGVAKIADFGIARLGTAALVEALASTAAPQAPGAASERSTAPELAATAAPANGSPALTMTGMLMGTPLYIAPELARGAKDADPSSDLWSFGLIAHELLTGNYPFTSPPVLDAAAGRTIVSPAAPLDGAIGALFARCLHLDPAQRPSAIQVVGAIDRERPPA